MPARTPHQQPKAIRGQITPQIIAQTHRPQAKSRVPQHPARPVSPYGVAKLASERYLFFYHCQYGLAATCLRYANVYGPRQNPHGEAGVVAIFSRRLLDGVLSRKGGGQIDDHRA